MSSCIYLDIGNSNVKWKYAGEYFETSNSEFNLAKLPKSSKIWVSNVSRSLVVEDNRNISIVEPQKSYKSLVNSYEKPNLLGSDRWLAMIASYKMSPNKGFIVVDIGTAVTIDLVDKSGLHMGGVIFPGLLKIRNTFNHFPVDKKNNSNEIGQSTKEAWSIGTLSILVSGINQKIHDIKVKVPDVNIYITGGGYDEVEKLLDFPHIYHKNLVLEGLELYANNMG